MALVKYGAPIDEVAGSIGGVVFQRTSAGHVARIRSKPRVVRSPAASERTSALSTHSMEWYTALTQPQRDSWDTAAAATTWVNSLGQNYSPTGMAAYIRSQIRATSAAYTGSPLAPTVLTEPDPSLVFAYTAPTAIRLTSWGSWPTSPNSRITFWTSLGQRPSIHTFNHPWTFAGWATASVRPTPPWTFFNLDNPHPDQRVFIRFHIYVQENPTPNPPWERGRASHLLFDDVFAPAYP